jgi:DnaJ-class molecular chaperone
MPVADRRRDRWVLHGIVIAFLGVLIAWSGMYGFSSLLGCPDCKGTGAVTVSFAYESASEGDRPPERKQVSYKTPCETCRGAGIIPVTRQTLAAMFPRICAALWGCVCVAVALGLFWGMKVVDCGLCGASGRLSLEAIPPGEMAFRVDTICVACEGRGWLGRLDRWVLRHSSP